MRIVIDINDNIFKNIPVESMSRERRQNILIQQITDYIISHKLADKLFVKYLEDESDWDK